MKEIQTKELCEYGCGNIAKYELANGKKCCSKSANSCQANKKKNSISKICDRECPYCHEKFEQINGRTFANHVRWCKKNPKHDECCGKKFKEKLSNTLKENVLNKHGQIKTFVVECETCHTTFKVQEYENDFPSKSRYFCSKTCAHKYAASCVKRENVSKARKKFDTEHPGFWTKDHKPLVKEIRQCKWCQTKFETTNKSYKQCCSLACSAKYREFKIFEKKLNTAISDVERIKLEFQKYRLEASFTFNLKDFPEEFDFSLIEKYGWYRAKNHGNNLNGISRDHMYSIKDGFLNKIDPKIIAHPANCRLMRQKDNARKHSKSSISFEELLERIKIWDQKYKK